MKVCAVTGHRNISENKIEFVRRELRREIELAVSDGYITFMSGFADGVDIEFVEIVVEIKQDNPDIIIEVALPYRDRLRTKNKLFHELLDNCDIITVTSEEYNKSCFHRRNKYMIENSERVIAVYDGRQKGGTFHALKIAEKYNREIKLIKI